MKVIARILLVLAAAFALLIMSMNIWGALTLGQYTPDPNAVRDGEANRVVLVTGATGSAGDGLLKAAMESPEVDKVYAITRRMSPRLEAGQASGRVEVIMQEDFTDYSMLTEQLAEVNTVLWGLGTTSIGMDPELYRKIHEDFPVAFVTAWLAARKGQGPMAFHYVTGMGTGEDEDAQWAKDKGRAERRIAEMGEGQNMKGYGHRSAWIRPTDENAHLGIYLGEPLLVPGHLVIRGIDLGRAMLEISARTEELPNGTLIDNADSLAYADLYAPGVRR